MKLYIISNRLPVKAVAEQDTFVFSRSEGGLTTGLNSLQGNYEKHWVGWPGICTDKEEEKQDICHRLEEMNLHPIFLSHEQYKNYYEGYSNSTLWPLCHYFLPIHYIERVSGNYNPQIQISAESETKRSIFREKDKTKRSKKESAQHSKSRNKSFVMTSVSAL